MTEKLVVKGMPEDPGKQVLSFPLDNFKERSSLVRMGITISKRGLFFSPFMYLCFIFISKVLGPVTNGPKIGFTDPLLLSFIGGLILFSWFLTLAWYWITPDELTVTLYAKGLVLHFVPERYSFESRFLPFESIPCITKDLSYGEEYLKIGGFFTMEDPFYLPSTEHDDKILIAYMVFKAEEGGSSL